MENDLVFRSPCEADLDAVAVLETSCFASPWKREFFHEELNAVGRFNLVIQTRDGRLVGYLFTMHYLDELHVNKIAVGDEWRRFGLATQLMERCSAFALENEIRLITLEVRESNAAARGLYRNLGFSESYLRPRYYTDGEGAIVMAKKVQPG